MEILQQINYEALLLTMITGLCILTGLYKTIKKHQDEEVIISKTANMTKKEQDELEKKLQNTLKGTKKNKYIVICPYCEERKGKIFETLGYKVNSRVCEKCKKDKFN